MGSYMTPETFTKLQSKVPRSNIIFHNSANHHGTNYVFFKALIRMLSKMIFLSKSKIINLMLWHFCVHFCDKHTMPPKLLPHPPHYAPPPPQSLHQAVGVGGLPILPQGLQLFPNERLEPRLRPLHEEKPPSFQLVIWQSCMSPSTTTTSFYRFSLTSVKCYILPFGSFQVVKVLQPSVECAISKKLLLPSGSLQSFATNFQESKINATNHLPQVPNNIIDFCNLSLVMNQRVVTLFLPLAKSIVIGHRV